MHVHITHIILSTYLHTNTCTYSIDMCQYRYIQYKHVKFCVNLGWRGQLEDSQGGRGGKGGWWWGDLIMYRKFYQTNKQTNTTIIWRSVSTSRRGPYFHTVVTEHPPTTWYFDGDMPRYNVSPCFDISTTGWGRGGLLYSQGPLSKHHLRGYCPGLPPPHPSARLSPLSPKAKNLYGWSEPSQMEVVKTSPEEGKSEENIFNVGSLTSYS